MELGRVDPTIFSKACDGLVVGGDIKIGGQKRVWRCAYKQRAYVLKALMGDVATLGRVKRELAIMKECRSRYLPQLGPLPLGELTTSDGTPILYFLEEYIEGLPLASVASPLPWQSIVTIGICVSEALDVLRLSGYLHRDVKPMNIIQKSASHYVLIDAGLALAAHGDTLTAPGAVVGTKPYLSPEQIKLPAKQLDIRSDLFSLGITMYQYATGEHPFFNDETPQGDVVHNILNCEAPPADRFNSTLPSALVAVLEKTLRKDRDVRYHSLEDFRTELRSIA